MGEREALKQDGKNTKAQKEIVDETSFKYLTFTIDTETYGIDIQSIMQIIGIQDITYIPEQDEYVKGVINLRGQIIPVIEVRVKFKKDIIEYDDRTCIIVVSQDDIMVGLIVDRVSEVLNIKNSQVAQTPKVKKEKNVEYISGIANLNNSIIMLLDVRKMLDMEG